jgi:outer membrane protein assembly factor BamB
VGDLLLLQTAFPHTLYALDIHQQAAPVRWSFTPPSDRRAAGLTCCEASVGGPVAAEGQVVLNTLDGHTVALDGATGQIRWNVKTASLESGETLATSALIAGDRIIIGSAGDDFGARGWVAGLEAHSGVTVWKRFNWSGCRRRHRSRFRASISA